MKKPYLTIPLLALALIATGCVTSNKNDDANTNAAVDTSVATTASADAEQVDAQDVAMEDSEIADSMTEDDKYADWKTYTDKEYGFSFRYPSDWTVAQQALVDYSAENESMHGINAGSAYFIILTDSTNTHKDIHISLYSEDYQTMYSNADYSKSSSTFCDDRGNENRSCQYNESENIIRENEYLNPECSPVFITKEINANPNPISIFKVAVSDTTYTDLSKSLFGEPFKNDDVCSGNIDIDSKIVKYLDIDGFVESLSNKDAQQYKIWKSISSSIQFNS